MGDWDFEAEITFPATEQVGRSDSQAPSFYASFRYAEIHEGRFSIARPVSGFQLDRTPRDPSRDLLRAIDLRFRFPDRRFYEALRDNTHLWPQLFDVFRGKRPVARGSLVRWRDKVTPIETEIERLLFELRSVIAEDDVKQILNLLYHSEWECAADLIWASASAGEGPLASTEYLRLLDLADRTGANVAKLQRDFPILRVG